MLDVYFGGLFIVLAIGICRVLGGLFVVALDLMYETSAKKSIRVTTFIFFVTAVGMWVWPLFAVAGVVYGFGWGAFTTARVIRHRSFDF